MASVDPDRGTVSSDETAAGPPATPRATSTAARFTPGTLLQGRYRIVAPLGKGGMGEVYRADDIRLGQPVALKFLPAALAAEAGRLERMVDEVRIGRKISHPNVCRLYDIAEADGHHFLVMEYVDGEDLASLLRRIGRLPGDKALEIARGVCAGLAAAHEKGVIHRDLKPANVMIDGKGHARIADFGLAALAEQGPASGLAGTPAYMAPEQLQGEGASLQSDVFALGLVISEMLTGQRVFEPSTLEQLQALHAQWKPASLSSSGKDVDPALERVVQRCLARDPKDRPASALVVLATLPGGDPLQAAILAGETPSPEMVAAAAKVGDLRPVSAWTCLLCGLIGLGLLAFLGGQAMLYQVTPLELPPDALAARAREVLAKLGHRDGAVDSAQGFEVDRALLEHVRAQQASPLWWRKLRTSRPGPYRFYYRQSPESLFSQSWTLTQPWLTPAELGRVTRTDPPLNVPGMKEVVLDSEGRLVRFVALPRPGDAAPGLPAESDWALEIAEAGLDAAKLRPATPLWLAPVDSDRKAAWVGVNPDDPDVAIRVEAASFRGRPVYFEVTGPWTQPGRAVSRVSPGLLARVGFNVFAVAVTVAAAVLVRRNLRLGRGDRRGALRLATFTFSTLVLANFLRADHTSYWVAQFHLIVQILSQGLYLATAVWLTYIALEPAVRRRWPDALISWSRLLTGRFQDPLVGRDVLAGVLAGLAVTSTLPLTRLLPVWLGGNPPVPVYWTSMLSASSHAAHFFQSAAVATIQSLMGLFFIYVLHVFVKRVWAARLLYLLVFLPVAGWSAGGVADRIGAALAGLVFLAAMLTLLLRFGQLAMAVFMFSFWVLVLNPHTLDWSAWYSGRSFAVLAFFAALLVFSFYVSLGGKPLFGRALLED